MIKTCTIATVFATALAANAATFGSFITGNENFNALVPAASAASAQSAKALSPLEEAVAEWKETGKTLHAAQNWQSIMSEFVQGDKSELKNLSGKEKKTQFLELCNRLALLKLAGELASALDKSDDADTIEEVATKERKRAIDTFFSKGALADDLKGDVECALQSVKAELYDDDRERESAIEFATKELKKRKPIEWQRPDAVLDAISYAAELPAEAYAIVLDSDSVPYLLKNAPKALLDWIIGTVAGVQSGFDGGYSDFEFAPITDKRLGFIDATVKTHAGEIKSAWKYEDGKCIWRFTIPQGTKATVCVNGMCTRYNAGDWTVEIK